MRKVHACAFVDQLMSELWTATGIDYRRRIGQWDEMRILLDRDVDLEIVQLRFVVTLVRVMNPTDLERLLEFCVSTKPKAVAELLLLVTCAKEPERITDRAHWLQCDHHQVMLAQTLACYVRCMMSEFPLQPDESTPVAEQMEQSDLSRKLISWGILMMSIDNIEVLARALTTLSTEEGIRFIANVANRVCSGRRHPSTQEFKQLLEQERLGKSFLDIN